MPERRREDERFHDTASRRYPMTGLEMAVLILSIALVLLQIVHELIAIYKDMGGREPGDR